MEAKFRDLRDEAIITIFTHGECVCYSSSNGHSEILHLSYNDDLLKELFEGEVEWYRKDPNYEEIT